MQTFTIGFTQKTAESFFGLLRDNNVSKLLDVRLNNVSQLAGFSKRDDLRFFLRELCKAEYIHVAELAPTAPMLKAYQNKSINWDEYANRFRELLYKRNIEDFLNRNMLENSCLLCSEHQPHFCHRRLVLEYLNEHWQTEIKIIHLT